jgi:adenosylcobinamide-phosphate synthase
MNPLGLNLEQVSSQTAAGVLPHLAILIFFLVLHLAAGAVTPYREGRKPFLRMAFERLAKGLEQRLNRAERNAAQLAVRGFIALLIAAVAAALVAYAMRFVPKGPAGWIAELVFLSLCISVMGLNKVLREVVRRMRKEETGKAVIALQHYYADSLRHGDDYTINRRALEHAAIEFNRAFFAPAAWYVAGGPEMLAFYIALTAAHDVIPRGAAYGRMARLVQNVIDLPAIGAALLLCIAALFVNTGNAWRALKVAMTQGARFDSLPRGWLVGAIAGGLNATLAGPVKSGDSVTQSRAWIGPEGATAKISIIYVERGRLLVFAGFLCGIVLFSGVFMAFLYFT